MGARPTDGGLDRPELVLPQLVELAPLLQLLNSKEARGPVNEVDLGEVALDDLFDFLDPNAEPGEPIGDFVGGRVDGEGMLDVRSERVARSGERRGRQLSARAARARRTRQPA